MSTVRDKKRADTENTTIKSDILLIEDQKSYALTLAENLNKITKHKITITSSLEQTKKALESSNNYCLAISDMILPDSDSGETVKLLTEHSVPTIAISGHYTDDDYEKIINYGAIDFVLKNSLNTQEYISKLALRFLNNKNITVLVVDDNESYRKMLTVFLNKYNYNVITANNGKEALDKLTENPQIKLVLTDYDMPEMNGLELTFKIRNNSSFNKKLPIIGISASEKKQTSTQFLKHGADDFLVKPFSYDELICRINQSIEHFENFETIKYTAYHDSLTSLYNRRFFFEQGIPWYKKSITENKQMFATIIDIDNFKSVNDTYGHDIGDLAIKHLAKLLLAKFHGALLARIGGEEFAILSDNPKIVDTLGQFRSELEASHIYVAKTNLNLSITASIGISSKPANDLDELLKYADENLYTAKKTGKNKIVFQ